MKSTEFITERTWFDKWMDQYVDSGEVLRESLSMTETFNNDARHEKLVNDFIYLHTTNSTSPVVGNDYFPVGFVLNGHLGRLQILSSEDKVTLVKIISSKEFEVLSNGIIHTFPYKFMSNFAAGATFFYDTDVESHGMITTISYALSVSEWDTEQVVIMQNGERKTI